MGPGGKTGGEGDPGADKGSKKRTDFVVVFLWREPTPSDTLLTPVADAPTTPSGSSGAPGTPGSVPPGGSGQLGR